MNRDKLASKNNRTAVLAVTVVAGMLGLSFAFVPLYTLFCQVTGLSGTPMIVDANTTVVANRPIKVRFDANVHPDLPWEFKPADRQVTMMLGETVRINYLAMNLSEKPVSGISTFNVTPLKAAQYFSKIECFCFQEQMLQPSEKIELPVVFFVDPALAKDSRSNEVQTITLSYTFFRSLDDVPEDEIDPTKGDKITTARFADNIEN